MTMMQKINKLEKPGRPQGNFHALFGRSAAFYGHFRADAVTSEWSTRISSINRDIQNLDVTDQKKRLLKARIKVIGLSSFSSYNKNSAALNLTIEEFASLKSLSKNDNLIIQKSDKGNSISIIDKDDYLQKMQNFLSDSS